MTVIEHNNLSVAVSIYAAIILSGVFLDGCSPLVYELVSEAAYPVGEGTSSSFLQMLFVLAGIAFTSVQEIPNIGRGWGCRHTCATNVGNDCGLYVYLCNRSH